MRAARQVIRLDQDVGGHVQESVPDNAVTTAITFIVVEIAKKKKSKKQQQVNTVIVQRFFSKVT